jgi:hypothetical protein
MDSHLYRLLSKQDVDRRWIRIAFRLLGAIAFCMMAMIVGQISGLQLIVLLGFLSTLPLFLFAFSIWFIPPLLRFLGYYSLWLSAFSVRLDDWLEIKPR